MKTPITHVEVRRWERIAPCDKRLPVGTPRHPGESVWSARVFHGVEGSTFHRADSWRNMEHALGWAVWPDGDMPHSGLSASLAEDSITYSVVRVARKADLI